ncbi:p21-activated protein kinase-interacting protein 1-like [Rhincodon typus]|uniref:p21-activated protein kinase-interacting protein 1-like n=1 Tax=Rhincodon typus TaxID=259920 RepID=UPI0009A29CD6|nr:p21-activated protein kinase-interacting protein 1-like [Rhincodon typus]
MDVEVRTDSEVVLIGGCYEQIIFGYRIKRPGQNWNIEPDFTHHAHTASLTTVAINDCYVATGSKDETIQLYNMKKKIDQGSLLYHDGTITCLEFHGNTHLLSGAEDGLICVWDIKRWDCLKTIRAHKGHVSSLSVHPSGKLALSVGTDKTLRTWNLIDGKSAFIKNINQNAHIVQWSPSGDSYIVVSNNRLDVYNLMTASIHGTIVCKMRISSVKFITESIIAIAGDEEHVRLYNTITKTCLSEFKAHDIRVKVMHFFSMAQSHVLATASSDGYIKLWQIDIKKIQSCPLLLSEVNTSARLTCLAVWLSNPQSIGQGIEEQVTHCEGDESSNKCFKQEESKIEEATLGGDHKHPQKREGKILYKRKIAVETKERRKKKLEMNDSL